jgi:RNA polymerase sigma-70 factor (ECF subfamily)
MATTFNAGVGTRIDDPRVDKRARLRSVKADPEQTLHEVYHWHHDRLVGYFVNRTHDRPLAEDLAHDTILRFAGALKNFDTARPVWPYLRTIAGNVLIDHQRHAAVQRIVDVHDEFADQPALGAGVDDTVVLRELLERAVNDLPERQRIAVDLRCARGWSVADAAVFLGIATGAFSQLLFRAKENLKATLEESGARMGGVVAPLVLCMRLRTRELNGRIRDVVQAPSTAFSVELLASVAVVATIGITAAVGISPAVGELQQESMQTIELAPREAIRSLLHQTVQPERAATVGAHHSVQAATSPDSATQDTTPPPSREATVIEAPSAVPDSGGSVAVDEGEEYFVVSHELAARTGVDEMEEIGADGTTVGITCTGPEGRLLCGQGE